VVGADFAKPIRTARTLRGRGGDTLVGVIVKLKGDPLATYKGDVPGLGATSPLARGEAKVNLQSRESVQYRAYLKAKRDTLKTNASKTIRALTIGHEYDLVINGISAVVPQDQIGALAALPDVEAIYPDELQQLNTDRSPQFIGAPTVWNQLGGQGSAGEGVIVGVLDSGLWPEHPSYSDPDPLGKPYAAPPPPLSGTRQCEFTGGPNPGPAFTCNNKLIGADRFMATYDLVIGLLPTEYSTARDDNGHGTHTSSTAAGNRGVAASIFGISRGTVSGIAPRAHVIMYKVCGDQGCFQSDSAAAVQKAIQDGVNVINFSISGGGNPYADTVEQAFLQAYAAGVFVAASAGNSGPAAETVDHRGPWVTTVAASTSDRHFLSDLKLTAGNGDTLTLKGASVTTGISTPKPVVLATAVGSDALCVTPIPANSLTNEIVVCQRGPNRVLKSRNVFLGGGDGMILYNATRLGVFTDNHWVPTIHLENDAGAQLLTFLSGHTGVVATFTQSTARTVKGDVMTTFSSRGGPGQSLGVSKPDITAPGIQILAGNTPTPATAAGGPPGELFQSIAGTSMSSPHIAGSGALIKALHPTWTPGQIKSALMTTAKTKGVVKDDGVTPADPFDDGSGRVDLTVAGNPGLTFDVSAADYVNHANDLWNVNYPSVYIPVMPGIITVQRTAHSVLGNTSTWEFDTKEPSDVEIKTPDKFNISSGGDVTFSITIDARDVPIGQTRFATLTLKEKGGGKRVLHLPITIVRKQPAVTLDKTCAPGTIKVDETTTCTITMANTTFDNSTVTMTDKVPSKLKLDKTSVINATVSGSTVTFNGTLAGAAPPDVSLAPGSSVAGYLPLSLFGISPIPGVGDDTITNFTTAPFTYGGETYTSLGVSSNGYLVVGGGSGPDNSLNNQNFPNPTRPNNVLAGFWTDLNPSVAGQIRIGSLTDGLDTWIVVDWAGVREFSTAGNLHSFEIWIGVNGDTNPGEDISFAYGTNTGNGDLGFASVGVENRFGNRGNNTYFDGAGTLPTNGTELRVTSAPPTAGETRIVAFNATGKSKGDWVNYALMTGSTFPGTEVARFAGTVTKK
jgi:subtilisin family serine protease